MLCKASTGVQQRDCAQQKGERASRSHAVRPDARLTRSHGPRHVTRRASPSRPPFLLLSSPCSAHTRPAVRPAGSERVHKLRSWLAHMQFDPVRARPFLRRAATMEDGRCEVGASALQAAQRLQPSPPAARCVASASEASDSDGQMMSCKRGGAGS